MHGCLDEAQDEYRDGKYENLNLVSRALWDYFPTPPPVLAFSPPSPIVIFKQSLYHKNLWALQQGEEKEKNVHRRTQAFSVCFKKKKSQSPV